MIISAQKGKQNKIHISIDGEYRLTVDADFWFSCGYISGDEIDEEQYKALEANIFKRRCFNRALNILSRRDHSEKELFDKLARADGDEAAASAVEKIKALGYIDDERYAAALAKELAERKGKSERAILSELIHRGIDRNTAENAISSLTLDECDKINILLNSKYRRKLETEKGRQQVFNALLRLGYGYSEIRSALRDYDECIEEEDI
ncbi:MAG: regulatory protein RecX [Clostridia bacterium]|nr:regulatory protein RecX [Clostridia bacterium]